MASISTDSFKHIARLDVFTIMGGSSGGKKRIIAKGEIDWQSPDWNTIRTNVVFNNPVRVCWVKPAVPETLFHESPSSVEICQVSTLAAVMLLLPSRFKVSCTSFGTATPPGQAVTSTNSLGGSGLSGTGLTISPVSVPLVISGASIVTVALQTLVFPEASAIVSATVFAPISSQPKVV